MYRFVVVRALGAGGLTLLGLFTCAASNLTVRAQALEYGSSPWLVCVNNTEAAEVAARYMSPEPAENATVTAGTPVVFSGESKQPLTFKIASSPALLATPDIDTGAGLLQQQGTASFYKFTSTKAAATPRTIYWAASFTFTPEDCEAPVTLTSPVHTLTVATSTAELAAAKQQQEEQAARRQHEEQAAAQKAAEEAAAHGTIVLDSSTIRVHGRRDMLVELTCSDIAPCAGVLNLTIRAPAGKHEAKHTTTQKLGAGNFSIAAGKTTTIKIATGKQTLALLASAHGHLDATLTILRASPAPRGTQRKRVLLRE